MSLVKIAELEKQIDFLNARILELESEQNSLGALATKPALKTCVMCSGKGWYHMPHAYPPGMAAPEVKVNCMQCSVKQKIMATVK